MLYKCLGIYISSNYCFCILWINTHIISGCYRLSHLPTQGISLLLSVMSVPTHTPINSMCGPSFIYTCVLVWEGDSHSYCCEVTSFAMICISLTIRDDEHFICPPAICKSSMGLSIHILCPPFNRVEFYNCRGCWILCISLYILNI